MVIIRVLVLVEVTVRVVVVLLVLRELRYCITSVMVACMTVTVEDAEILGDALTASMELRSVVSWDSKIVGYT
jgi:hypothetical protein